MHSLLSKCSSFLYIILCLSNFRESANERANMFLEVLAVFCFFCQVT
jgi:hypothetical protein